MDFKALMAAQIAKAKPSSTTTTTNTSKYQRRSETEAKRQAEYAAEQARLEKEREERAVKKRKLEEDEAEKVALREAKMRKLADESKIRREAEEKEEERRRRKRLGLPELVEGDEGAKEGSPLNETQSDIPDDELRTKLRELGEPAKLFDEDHETTLRRYYKLTAKSLSKPKFSKGPIPTTLEPISEKDMLLPTKVPAKDTKEYDFLHRQVASYFTLLLSEWNIALSARETSVKESQSGRAALATYQYVIRDLTPMFRKLESRALPSDVLNPLVEITRNIQARRYVDANDGYLRLSIGKAAWPIGVTMVGIHERSARERIHDGGEDKAHIMSDEVTRKMLQSVKRCLSFAQTRWPPDDIGQLMG